MSDTSITVGSKYKTTPVGLVAKSKADFGEWEVALGVCCDLHRSSQWWVGDLLNIGEHTYGETYAQALESTGFDEGYLRNLKYVCSRIPLSLRSDKLTFSHHQLVASLEPEKQEEWIGKAIENQWTVKELREAMQGADGDEEDGDGDADDLSDVLSTVQDYLDSLDDDKQRLAALHGIERKLKSMEKKYGGTR